MNSKRKLLEKTVRHLPKELSRAAWFFLEWGGKTSGNVFEEKYRPLAIPKGGLEIILEVELKIKDKDRKNLERFQDIHENNYQNNENTGDYSIYDLAVFNLKRENFGATSKSQEFENKEKEDHLVSDNDEKLFV